MRGGRWEGAGVRSGEGREPRPSAAARSGLTSPRPPRPGAITSSILPRDAAALSLDSHAPGPEDEAYALPDIKPRDALN